MSREFGYACVIQRLRPMTTGTAGNATAYDVESVRRQFPILAREVYGKPLVYLDSAASAQKPKMVIEADGALLPRVLRQRSPRRPPPERQKSTDAYEEARRQDQLLHRRRLPARGGLRPRHHRGHQPRRLDLRPPASRRRRRGTHHGDGAPLEHRALADALRAAGRQARRRADEPTRRTDLGRVREAGSPNAQNSSPASTSRTPWAPSTRSPR